MTMIVLGIDPGALATGIVIVDFTAPTIPDLLAHTTIRRTTTGPEYLPVELDYLEQIYAVVARARVDVIGVEDVTPPNLHMARAAYNTGPVLATAIVAGYCTSFAAHGRIIQVPPHGNGGGPLGGYPGELVSERERLQPNWIRRTSGDKAALRHERSAFDVARMAHRLARREKPTSMVERTDTNPTARPRPA